MWNSLGEWKYFIWKANNDDVTRGFLINIHDVGKAPLTNTAFWLGRHWWSYHFMRYTLVMSSFYASWSWWLHQFSYSSYQKQGLPSTIRLALDLITGFKQSNFLPLSDPTWGAFEFEGAMWNSLGEWKYFIWKANNDDVTRGFLINIHDVGKALLTNTAFWLDRYWWCHHFMRYTLVMSSLYAHHWGNFL